MVEHINILKEIVENLVHTVEVESVDNASGTDSVLVVCNTYYLNTCKVVEVDGLKYSVTAFTINASLTLEPLGHTTLVDAGTTSFTIAAPTFYHGTPKAVSIEKSTDENVPDRQGPYVWILEVLKIDPPEDIDASLTRSTMRGVNIFCLDDIDEEHGWNVDDHYLNVISPQNNELDFIFAAFQTFIGIYFNELDKPARTNHADFGKYIVDRGYENTILNEPLSGVQGVLDIPFVIEPEICCQKGSVEVCKPVLSTFNGTPTESNNSGTTKNVIVQTDDTVPVPIGTLLVNTESEMRVEVGVGGSPVDTDFNSTPTGVDTPAGQNLAINVVDASDGVTPIGTLTVNTANEKKIEVTGAGAVFYNLPQPVWQSSNNTYDEGWHYQNNTYDQTIPATGILQSLDPDDWYKVVHDKEGLGNLFRFWGLANVGYYNSDDGTYRLANGDLSDRATIFSDDDYAFDRLTGIAYRTVRGGAATRVTALNGAAAATFNSFSDWFLPIRSFFESIVDPTLDRPLYGTDSPVFDIQLQLHTASQDGTNPATTGVGGDTGGFTRARAYTLSDITWYCRKAF